MGEFSVRSFMYHSFRFFTLVHTAYLHPIVTWHFRLLPGSRSAHRVFEYVNADSDVFCWDYAFVQGMQQTQSFMITRFSENQAREITYQKALFSLPRLTRLKEQSLLYFSVFNPQDSFITRRFLSRKLAQNQSRIMFTWHRTGFNQSLVFGVVIFVSILFFFISN